MKSKFSECPDFSCSRSDGTLEPVTSSFPAASESLRTPSQAQLSSQLEFRAEKPLTQLKGPLSQQAIAHHWATNQHGVYRAERAIAPPPPLPNTTIRYDNFIYTRYFHQLIKLIIYSNISIYLTTIKLLITIQIKKIK